MPPTSVVGSLRNSRSRRVGSPNLLISIIFILGKSGAPATCARLGRLWRSLRGRRRVMRVPFPKPEGFWAPPSGCRMRLGGVSNLMDRKRADGDLGDVDNWYDLFVSECTNEGVRTVAKSAKSRGSLRKTFVLDGTDLPIGLPKSPHYTHAIAIHIKMNPKVVQRHPWASDGHAKGFLGFIKIIFDGLRGFSGLTLR